MNMLTFHKQLLFVCLTFFTSHLYAESYDKSFFVGKVISDTSTFEYNSFSPPLKHIFKSNNKIEIRLKISPSFDDEEYIILAFNKDWRGRYYRRYTFSHFIDSTGKRKDYEEKNFKKNINYDTLFSKLVHNDIFSLKLDDVDESIVDYDSEKDEFLTMKESVCDGISYYLQFKIGNQFRTYGFSNPQAFTHVTQLRQFVRIINLLQNCVAK